MFYQVVRVNWPLRQEGHGNLQDSPASGVPLLSQGEGWVRDGVLRPSTLPSCSSSSFVVDPFRQTLRLRTGKWRKGIYREYFRSRAAPIPANLHRPDPLDADAVVPARQLGLALPAGNSDGRSVRLPDDG